MLVVGMQAQEEIEGIACPDRIDVFPVGLGEHHVEEILAVTPRVVGRHKGESLFHAEGHGRNGAHLGNQESGGFIKMGKVLFAIIGGHFGVIGPEGIEHRRENRHGVGVVGKAFKVIVHAGVNRRTAAHQFAKGVQFFLGGQFPIDDQHGGLEEVGLSRQLLDGVTPMPQDPLFAVNKSDIAQAGTGVAIAFIKGNVTGFRAQAAYIKGFFALGSKNKGEFVIGIVEANECSLLLHVSGCIQ